MKHNHYPFTSCLIVVLTQLSIFFRMSSLDAYYVSQALFIPEARVCGVPLSSVVCLIKDSGISVERTVCSVSVSPLVWFPVQLSGLVK